MSAGYSPAPFSYQPDRTIHDAEGTPLARCYADRNGEANGPLFAAAPELLEALEALLNQDCPNRQYVSGHPAAEQARAAIARATGAV